MLTTFDRYLLFRYLYVVVGMFLAAWGLYVIVDGFTNIDMRGASERAGPLGLLTQLGMYYLYQSTMIFDLVGPTIGVMSIMIVLALMLRQGEVHPVLAAGVPTYRLMWPFFVGIMLVNLLLIGNQEYLIPRIADRLQGPRGEVQSAGRAVEPQYDTQTWIFFSGRQLFLGERTIKEAEFRLPSTLTTMQRPLRAKEAVNLPASGDRPACWLLRDVSPKPNEIDLTEEGREIVIPRKNGTDLFLVCDMTVEQLYKQNTAFKYLSTIDLLRRVQRPSGQTASIRGQIVQVHSRLTRPVLMVLGLFLVFPLIIRRERDSLIGNISVTMATLGCVFGLWQGGQFLGQSAVMPAELAAWSPLIFGGSLSAWLSGVMRT
ncbi:LptF/LptG family permease [Planctomyces sp. SH-PL14]|uniref:LptF/LptG family permease n=1 Tax=Planctomyces sp. SH-PL14 TaxID=1632864 RepID=UPI00078CF7A1|nr:LptF/LptG family permease [Planctomyces sp. SH-PL14]AMV21856.1 putative permease YjgP/YjgQ family protein [Planctomyces sp. SH-PL14]